MPLSRDDSNHIDDEICEDLFIKGHYQTMCGGKIISISYRKVVQYYLSQEKVQLKNKEHKLKSDEFMNEYLNLVNIPEVPKGRRADTSGKVYYSRI